MIQRTALFAAALLTAIALAFGLALAGFNPGVRPSTGDPTAASDPAPQSTVQVDTVYLTPPGTPQDITVTRTVSQHGEYENEHEGGRDD